ncbi:MAG: hypothetical protein IPL12_00830 [Bacteroidetes bacterium]|nr:hypothetical protein [Bacteroidota bacterium]
MHFGITRFTFIASLISMPFISFTQTTDMCGTDLEREKLLQTHPDILQREAEFDKRAMEKLTSIMRIEDETIVIPVVFHIIHDYGPENISDAQVYDAIAKINADFSATNTDFLATIPEYAGIAANCNIEFRLAQKELSGGCKMVLTALHRCEPMKVAMLLNTVVGKVVNI